MTYPSSLDLSDDRFLAAFHGDGFDRLAFPHRAHLRLAWLAVRRLGLPRSIEGVTSGIRALAAKGGHPGRYHDTLTRAWVYVVAAAIAARPDITDFDRFLEAYPALLDKDYLSRHYSAARLSSPEARRHWLAPDLEPIPGAPDTQEDAGSQDSSPLDLPLPAFRHAIERVPLPVAVIAAHDATHVHATTVSSVATILRPPAMLVACLRPDSRVLPVLRAAGGFAVSYLGSDQRAIAGRFAERGRGTDVAQFHGVPHVLGPYGAPIISGGPAWFECRLRDELSAGNHQIICGTVVAAGTTDARPLQRLHGDWV
jgi:flavin reductase (DIM6/NTAB) family NADH-FMN oxidoreductase RutF